MEVPEDRVPGLDTYQRAADTYAVPGAGHHVFGRRDFQRRGRRLVAVLAVYDSGHGQDDTIHG